MESFLGVCKAILTTLIYIIYPPMCPVCRAIVDERGELCESCASKVFHIDTEKNLPEILSGVMRITKYRDGTRDLLIRLKFDNDLTVLPALHKILAEVADRTEIRNFIANTDTATFVPLHKNRLAERGYNQTELIFNDWLVAQGVTTGNFLVRNKFTPKLYSFNRVERQEIMKGVFGVADGVDVAGKNVLIVDDIYTTGATVCECARVLKGAGAAKVYVMAFASDFGG